MAVSHRQAPRSAVPVVILAAGMFFLAIVAVQQLSSTNTPRQTLSALFHRPFTTQTVQNSTTSVQSQAELGDISQAGVSAGANYH